MTEKWSPAWQVVTCKDCGSTFQCTPSNDYYGSTCATDGQCESCLLVGHFGREVPVVTIDASGKEIPHEATP